MASAGGRDLRGGAYPGVRVIGALVLIGVAYFVALGLEPAVSRLIARKLPRWAAVTLVVVVVLAIVAGSVVAAVPPLVQQVGEFIGQVPHYIQQAQDHSSVIGRLNERFHLQQRITDTAHGFKDRLSPTSSCSASAERARAAPIPVRRGLQCGIPGAGGGQSGESH